MAARPSFLFLTFCSSRLIRLSSASDGSNPYLDLKMALTSFTNTLVKHLRPWYSLGQPPTIFCTFLFRSEPNGRSRLVRAILFCWSGFFNLLCNRLTTSPTKRSRRTFCWADRHGMAKSITLYISPQTWGLMPLEKNITTNPCQSHVPACSTGQACIPRHSPSSCWKKNWAKPTQSYLSHTCKTKSLLLKDYVQTIGNLWCAASFHNFHWSTRFDCMISKINQNYLHQTSIPPWSRKLKLSKTSLKTSARSRKWLLLSASVENTVQSCVLYTCILGQAWRSMMHHLETPVDVL